MSAQETEAAADMLVALKAVLGSRVFSIDFDENRMPGTERWHLRQMMIEAIDKATQPRTAANG